MTQSTAMNNAQRTKASMTRDELIAGFKSMGYYHKGVWECPACAEELILASQTVGYTGYTPPWGNSKCALHFHKKGSTVIACPCGWRKVLAVKPQQQQNKLQCKVRGCTHLLNKTDTDGLCVPCRAEIAGGGNPALYSQHCTNPPKRGCVHYMQGGNTDCVRVKCTKYDQIPVEKALVTCGCGKVLPKGRAKYCFTCRKPSAAVAALNDQEVASTKPTIDM